MGSLISVIVCTFNRAPYLIKALQSLDNQTLDLAFYEVIVVDNACTDNTKEVFQTYSTRSNWHYIYEPVIGLSRARNTGWENAKGDYILFMDDDAIAAPDCLEQYKKAYDIYHLETGCIGGRVELIWETPRPAWLHDGFLGILSEYHYSDTPIVLNNEQWLSACNLSIPKNVLQSLGGFREDLGRKGYSLLAGEEVYFRKQINDKGFRSIYYPQAQVKHHIMPSRLTKQWFRKSAYWAGRSDAISLRKDDTDLSLKNRIDLSVRRIVWSIPRFVLMVTAIKQSDRFKREYQIIESIGYIISLWDR